MSTKNPKQTAKTTTTKSAKQSKRTEPVSAAMHEKRSGAKETDVANVADAAIRRLRGLQPNARRAFLGGLRRGELGAIAGKLQINASGLARNKLETLVLEALAVENPDVEIDRSEPQEPEGEETPAGAPTAPQAAHDAPEDAPAPDVAPNADEAATGEPAANMEQPAAHAPAMPDEPASQKEEPAPAPHTDGDAQLAKYYTLDGKLVDIEQILASKTILNGIAISDFDADAIPRLLPGDAIHLETELAGTFTLRCEAAPPAEDTKRYTVDGESVALEEFIADNTAENVEPLAEDEIARLRAVRYGDQPLNGQERREFEQMMETRFEISVLSTEKRHAR